jgi:hypothetical protein
MLAQPNAYVILAPAGDVLTIWPSNRRGRRAVELVSHVPMHGAFSDLPCTMYAEHAVVCLLPGEAVCMLHLAT